MKVSLTLTWPRAIGLFREYGRSDAIERLIRQGEPIPPDCREFVAELVARAPRRKGSPKRNPPASQVLTDLDIYQTYQVLRAVGDTRESAIATIADRRELGDDQVSHAIRRAAARK